MKNTKTKVSLWGADVASFALVVGLVACAPAATEKTEAAPSPNAAAKYVTPEADEYGVVTADAWKDIYPNECASYMANESNSPDSGKKNCLEAYPALNTMYKGYAFSLDYDQAASHLYTLDSVKDTLRTQKKEQLANCITCKTPQFTALVNSEGDSVYVEKFNDMVDQFDEPVSCYNCHENDPKSNTVASKFFFDSLGSDADTIPKDAQVCGQCHNEYYFNSDTKVPANPYSGRACRARLARVRAFGWPVHGRESRTLDREDGNLPSLKGREVISRPFCATLKFLMSRSPARACASRRATACFAGKASTFVLMVRCSSASLRRRGLNFRAVP